MGYDTIMMDPAKNINCGDVVIIATGTGVIIIGKLVKYDIDRVVLMNPAVVQIHPTVKDGKQSSQIFMGLLTPDTITVNKSRFTVVPINIIFDVEKASESILGTYSDYAKQVDEQLFKKNMTEEELTAQEEFYKNL